MIADSINGAICSYLSSHATLTDVATKVFFHRVPTNAVMPWVLVMNSGGGRKLLTQAYREPIDTIPVYIDSQNQFAGYDLAQRVQAALEEYRGAMGNMKDVYIWSETFRDLDTFTNAYRYLVPIHVRYILDR